MKRKNKITLGIIGLATVALFAAGCTANFCTNEEKSRIAYAFEEGASEFLIGLPEDSTDVIATRSHGNVTQIIRASKDENGNIVSYSHSSQLNTVIESAKSSSIKVPSYNYFFELDSLAFEKTIEAYNTDPRNANNLIDVDHITDQELLNSCLEDYGYVRYYKDNNAFEGYRELNRNIRNNLDYDKHATVDFENFYISSMTTLVEKYRSCITTFNKDKDHNYIKYGNYGDGKSIILNSVSWKDAWGKGGHLIEGLIVYPVAWMVDSFAVAFAGGKNATSEAIQAKYMTGVPQLLSIVVVTVIVRLFIFLCTFKSTLAQRKMTELQPELAKIQQKYPNANTNQAQKQRLAEEQMRLYKKHKVNPLSQLLVLIIQFPVFIGVWGAMTGSAVLSTGAVMGLHLSDSIWDTLKIGPRTAGTGWWVALVLILLMSASQFFSMKVPQWIQKAKTKKVARLGKNPAQKQQNRTANIVSYVMLAMIVIMGFTLPAAMGVYWFVGAIVSLIQTVFTNVIFAGDRRKRK